MFLRCLADPVPVIGTVALLMTQSRQQSGTDMPVPVQSLCCLKQTPLLQFLQSSSKQAQVLVSIPDREIQHIQKQ